MAMYLVTVKWNETKSIKPVFSETRLFGIQSSVCKPTIHKWPHAIEILIT